MGVGVGVPVDVGVGVGLGAGVDEGSLPPLHPLVTSAIASNEAPMLAAVRRIPLLLRAAYRFSRAGAA